MQFLEGSDTQLKFEITQDGTAINYSEYSKFVLEMKYCDAIVEYEGTVENGNLVFTIFGESTKGRTGNVSADIRGLKQAKKVRFNQNTISGVILSSVVVPQGLTQN